ncbi:MAG: HD-GYP domain-containing protein [Lachnospiraceae bacterium]|nr:HD-GYP domain-containing protein [Lachnospiraceae bacterium]
MGDAPNNFLNDKDIERIPISRAVPGMELAKDIYSRNDQMVLGRGSILDAQKISKIMFYSVDTITVYKMEEQGEKTLTEQLKASVEFREFSQHYDKTVNVFKDSVNKVITENREIDGEELLGEIEDIIDQTGSNSRIFNMLHCIRDYDEMTYVHSVNVSLICNCFAKWLDMNEEDKRIITLGGLLHDIGKISIPREILLKPDSLTADEYEVVKTHTTKGYTILKEKRIDDRIKMIALQHHERADRTGYPYGKSGDEIEPFAMIVAIADVYDAMTSDRVYRPRICPFDVVQTLEDGNNKYNAGYLVPLLEQITEVYINHTVRLSNDSVGRVIMINRGELSKPVIQVKNEFLDLTKFRKLKIEEIL